MNLERTHVITAVVHTFPSGKTTQRADIVYLEDDFLMTKSRYFPHKGLSHFEIRQVILPHIQHHMTILKNHQVHDRSTRTYQFTTLDINRSNLPIRRSREPGILKYRLNFRYSSLCRIYQRTGTLLILFLCTRLGQ